MRDHGDRALWRWRPDRARPRAQNLPAIVEIVRDTARRAGEAIAAGERTIVLGGDCTVGIGTIAAHVATGDRVGLVYFDTHADLNVPSSVPEGAMDWMGMAHVLGVEGAEAELTAAGPRTPLLEPADVLLFGWGPDQATSFERDAIDALGIAAIPVGEVEADAIEAATRALARMEGRCDRLLVHFDVDVIDFTDMPLSENWGRNEGLPFATAMDALGALLGSPRFAGLTITECNPDHAEEGADGLERLAATVAGALTGP